MKFSETKFAGAIKTSTFLQLLVLVIATDIFVLAGLPTVVQALNPDLISANIPLLKFKDYFGTDTDPEVVVMGSSLVLAPAIHCDAAMLPSSDPEKMRIRKQAVGSYTKAKYFESALKDSSGQDISIYNLGMPGLMARDGYALLEEIVASKKHPSLIVLGLAARDFVGRKTVDPEKSAVLAALRQFQKEKKLSATALLTDFPSVASQHFESGKAELALAKCLLNGKVQDLRINGFKQPKIQAKPVAPKPAQEEIAEIQLPTPKVLRECKELYAGVYDSATPEMVQKQLDCLSRSLKLAEKAKLPIVLVNLPVTDRHKKLLSPELTKIYQDGIQLVAKQNSCTLIDMDIPGEFDSNTDFRDPIHLNAKGGRKFYNQLAAHLADRHVLSEAIASKEKVTTH